MEIFKPTIQDQATFSGSVDISGSLTITQNLNVVGELQGAATTASYISLANVDGFTDVSSSIEQRISSQELFSSSLNITPDFADIINKPPLISSSNQLAGETIDGDLTITGTVTAQEFHTEFVSASIIYDSGSTKFGNSADDRHEFTGSVNVSNGITGTLTGNASTATSASYAATGPFLSSYTETDTLASVTGRGASTTTDISIANGQPKLRLKETDSTNVDKELLVSGGDFYIRNLNDNDTAGTNLLLVDSSGNLSATGRGQFAGALRVTETGTAQNILIGNQDSAGTNAPAMIRGVNAALQFGVGDSWSGEGGNFTIRLELKNDGNAYFSNSLGIGTSGPSNQLHIWNENSAYAKLENNADNYLLLGAVGGSNRIYSRTPANAAYPFAIEIGSNTAVQIDTSSNVGIGTTAPVNKLHVRSAAAAPVLVLEGDSGNEQLILRRLSNTNEQLVLGFHSSDYAKIQAVEQNVGYRPLALNQDGGNVGIGNSNPLRKLHVVDTNPQIRVSYSTAGDDRYAEMAWGAFKGYAPDTANNGIVIGFEGGNSSNGRVDIVTGPTGASVPRISVLRNGSVGIGTTAPKDILDIKGGGVAEGGIAFGSKSVSISATFANVLTVSLGNHTGVYVKITAFGDWSSHSTIAYVGEFFLQNGAGGYMEPGIIIREDTNIYEASQDNDNVVAQIVDPGGSTGDRDFIIQLAATRSSGTPSGLPFTAHIQYEVRGQYKSIS